MNKGNKNQIISSIYAFVFILLAWQLLHLSIGEPMVPSPFTILERLVLLLQNRFYLHLVYSLYRILMAIAFSILIGVPLGILVGMNLWAEHIISPIVYLLYPIPKIAFLPIFMVIFGIGDQSKIILMITIIVFQVMIATRDGVKEIDATILKSAKLMNLKQIDIIIDVTLPAIAPNLFSALRISTGIAISALFFSENYATRYGIGYFIMNAWSMVDYKDMFAGVVALSLLSLALYKGIDTLEKRFCPWLR